VRSAIRRLRVLFSIGFRADARVAAAAFVLTIVSSVAGPLVGVWLATMVDAAAAGNVSDAIVAAGALALSWAASTVAGEYAVHSSWSLHVHIMRLVASEVIEVSGRVPTIELHERPDVADRVELLRQDILPLAYATTTIVWALGIVIRLATVVVILFGVHPALALLPLLGVPSLVAASWAQRTRQRAREEMVQDSRLSEHLFTLGTTPGPGKELRIFRLASEISGRHRTLRQRILLAERRVEARATLATTLGWLLYALGYAGAIVFVTALAIDGQATVGDVLLVIALSAQIQQELGSAYGLIGELVQTMRIVDHYLWLQDYADMAMARRRPSSSAPEKLTEGIRFEGVRFRYPGTDVDVLRDIDLTIPAGSALAIVGLNGAGKTTLAKLLAGFYEPTEGRITVDGVDLRDLDQVEWRKRLSACFQDFVHFEYLARESVGLGDLPRIEDESWITGALERANATDVTEHLPDGLGTLLGQEYGDGVELSTGQWQKVALGRAMMREDPLLLILDEPTASLDAYTEHALFERYARASERAGRDLGAITVLISHRFSTVRMADLVVVLEDGRVLQTGTHDELERVHGPYRELYELQSRAYR
jgi:ATP-binding cassette subfamily B protein